MTATLVIESGQQKTILMDTLEEALAHESARIFASMKLAERKIRSFELKYNINSKDLETSSVEESGISEDDMVEWLGEYRLYLKTEQKFRSLSELSLC